MWDMKRHQKIGARQDRGFVTTRVNNKGRIKYWSWHTVSNGTVGLIQSAGVIITLSSQAWARLLCFDTSTRGLLLLPLPLISSAPLLSFLSHPDQPHVGHAETTVPNVNYKEICS